MFRFVPLRASVDARLSQIDSHYIDVPGHPAEERDAVADGEKASPIYSFYSMFC